MPGRIYGDPFAGRLPGRVGPAVIFPGILQRHGTPAGEVRPEVEPAEPAFAFVVIGLDAPNLGSLRRAGLDALEEVGPPPGLHCVTDDVSPGNTLPEVVPYPGCSMLPCVEVVDALCAERDFAAPLHKGLHTMIDRIHVTGSSGFRDGKCTPWVTQGHLNHPSRKRLSGDRQTIGCCTDSHILRWLFPDFLDCALQHATILGSVQYCGCAQIHCGCRPHEMSPRKLRQAPGMARGGLSH